MFWGNKSVKVFKGESVALVLVVHMLTLTLSMVGITLAHMRPGVCFFLLIGKIEISLLDPSSIMSFIWQVNGPLILSLSSPVGSLRSVTGPLTDDPLDIQYTPRIVPGFDSSVLCK